MDRVLLTSDRRLSSKGPESAKGPESDGSCRQESEIIRINDYDAHSILLYSDCQISKRMHISRIRMLQTTSADT
jgi:hypothetical protein